MSQSISGVMQLPTNMNFDKIIVPGKYAGAAGATINGPDASIVSNYTLRVSHLSFNTTQVYQSLWYRSANAVRKFGRLCFNTTGADPLGGTWTFGPWEEFPTPSGGFSTGKSITAGFVSSTGRVKANIAVESVTGTFTGNITCVALTQTSDETKKGYVDVVDSGIVSIAKSLVAKQYIFNDDPEEIIHFGFLAQDVIAAFEAHDLNYKDYSLVQEIVVEDAEGNATIHYALNYTELMILRSL